MPDDLASHRRFHIYAVAGEGAGADDPNALTDEEAEKAVTAYTWPGFAEVRLFPRPEFEKYATPFEHAHSSLLGQGNWRAAPIVDETGQVIMYLGWFDWAFFYIPNDRMTEFDSMTADPRELAFDLPDLWKFQIVISDTNPAGMTNPFHPEMTYLVLTTIDGTVIQLCKGNSGKDGDMSSFQPGDLLAGWIASMIARLGLAALEFFAAEDALAAAGAGRLVGSVSAEEMEIHLARVLGQRAELRRLMAARVLSGDALRRQTQTILEDWGEQYGKRIEYLTTEQMQQRGIAARNLMSLQPAGIRNTLLVNKALFATDMQQQFYDEVVHELTADALGWSGSAGAETLPFVGEQFTVNNNAQKFLEEVIKSGANPRDVIDAFSRL